jgi:ABC-2 type transport system ATP-binding protein
VALIVRDLVKNYGRVRALNGVSLSLDRGTVMGLVGPNGAGKTTLIKSVLGLVKPNSGEILVDDMPAWIPEAKRLLAYSPEAPEAPPWETGCGLLESLAMLEGVSRSEARRLAREALERLGLLEYCGRKIAGMSKGMRKRLLIAQALIPRGKQYYLLDEPFSGLDPEWVAEVRKIILELRDSGAGVLVSSHILKELEDIADRVAIIHFGRVLFEGSLGELFEKAAKRPYIVVRVRDVEEAAQLLRSMGYSFTRVAAGSLRIQLHSIDEADKVLEALRRGGVKVLSYEVRETSLEDAYLALLGGEENA